MDKYSKWLALISHQLLIVEKLLNLSLAEKNIGWPDTKEVFDGFDKMIDIQSDKYQDLVKEEKEQCENPTSTG